MRRRLDGLLQGNHLGLVPGPGTEPGDARPYHPGDDVRRMDWSVTARTTEPHVRQTVADRELETWVVADLSRQPRLRHRRLREARPGGRRARRRRPPDPRRRQPDRRGRRHRRADWCGSRPAAAVAHARGLLRAASPQRRSAPGGTRGDLAAAIEQLRRPPRRRGLAVVISDFLGEPELGAPAARAVGAPRPARRRGARPARAGAARGRHWSCWPTRRPAASARSSTTPLLCREFAAAAAAHRERVAVGAAPRRRGAPAAAHRPRLDRRRRPVRRSPASDLVGAAPAGEPASFTAALVARCWPRSSSAGARRSATSLLLRRRRRDTLRVHQPGAARQGRAAAARLVRGTSRPPRCSSRWPCSPSRWRARRPRRRCRATGPPSCW